MFVSNSDIISLQKSRCQCSVHHQFNPERTYVTRVQSNLIPNAPGKGRRNRERRVLRRSMPNKLLSFCFPAVTHYFRAYLPPPKNTVTFGDRSCPAFFSLPALTPPFLTTAPNARRTIRKLAAGCSSIDLGGSRSPPREAARTAPWRAPPRSARRRSPRGPGV